MCWGWGWGGGAEIDLCGQAYEVMGTLGSRQQRSLKHWPEETRPDYDDVLLGIYLHKIT